MTRVLCGVVCSAMAVLAMAMILPEGRVGIAHAQEGWKPPRTPWGDPDLQGIWPGTESVGIPLQRPASFGTRNVLSEEEFAARQRQAQQQLEADHADFDLETADTSNAGQVGSATSPPPHWLERGTPSRQASLIVDPPDGRMPAISPSGQQRRSAGQAAQGARGPADSWQDRSLYDRCITRGLVGSVMPVIYNNGNEIVQAPGYVVIRNEMIHEARVIPLDGRPHVGPSIRLWMGDSRGRWEGNTLVIETTNFTDRTAVGGGNRHTESLVLTERLTLTGPDTLAYEATIADPDTWVRPWTIAFPWKSDPSYRLFEYACHEGNYAMRNVLSAARQEERAQR